MTLEQFTQAVKSDEMWLEAMRNPSRGKSLAAAIEKVYGQCVSDQTLLSKPITEHRKHIFNTLTVQKFGMTTGVQLQQEPVKRTEADIKELESVPVEVHQQRLNEWLKSIQEAPEPKRIARKVPGLTLAEIQEEGQERPKRNIYMRDDAYIHEHKKKLREDRIKTVTERHPELSPEEVEEYVDRKFADKI